jgi:cell division protein FtsI (penicillin-binding protein 3)
LTIDARVQQTAEEELQRILQEYQPKAATCVVMDVSTGAILAMASLPTFDPNEPAKSPPESRRNRAITDFYEPGSTFKTFAAAAALERKLWKRNETIFCENGVWALGYRTIHDTHAYGMLTLDDVIAKSSNIGAGKIASRLGVDGLYEAVRAFGFGELTRINLPGEARGMVHQRKEWTRDSLYSVAMGHEIGVTPLQLVAAFGAVVNGGVLYRPKVVQRIANEAGEELYTLHPQPLRRVISEQTSQQMREILARVVLPGGTGTRAFCPEYPIGGKTGTTRKIDPLTKTYSTTSYIASFCGFAPVTNPRLVCLVTVDEPRKGTGYYGGTVCCPVVREVLRKGLSVLNVPARSADEQKKAIADFRQVAAAH